MKKLINITLILTLLGFVSASWSLDLDTARGQGWVQELPNGFIKATDPKAKVLAEDINSKRKQAYESIAKKNNLTVDIVGKQAAEKIKAKLAK